MNLLLAWHSHFSVIICLKLTLRVVDDEPCLWDLMVPVIQEAYHEPNTVCGMLI